MNILKEILIPVFWVGGLGTVLGGLLAVAAKIFAVKVDERVALIEEALPGANCGACGYAGCKAYAVAVVEDGAKTNLCPVGGKPVAEAVSSIMGVAADDNIERMRAQVMCSGSHEFAHKKYAYAGAEDCICAANLDGGDKLCPNGCIGLGTCAAACPVGAIKVCDGVAAVDYTLCIGCGLCVASCPKQIIKLIPYDSTHWVGCMSREKGALTRKHCGIGCIACRICEKVCAFDAIKVIDNIAKIDYAKCTGCNMCVEKCPRNIIWSVERQELLGLSITKDELAVVSAAKK
ncbi:MAG: RnfABCDGE type electron transport complex subunit B [Clostridiales bacterium]|nr:RnfABCDGE type electron transport complex subunit B [Clostridiales bacterium]